MTQHQTATATAAASPVSREDVETYLPLVHQTVRRMARRLPANVSREDLVAAGVFGLLDALRKNADPANPSFEAYARIRIRGAIVDELRTQDWLPRRARWAASATNQQQNSDKAATTLAVVSLEDMAMGEQRAALIDETSKNPAEQAEANDARARLEAAVAELPERQRLIVSMHYFEGIRFKEIGALLGVSEPRVSQLHARAMERLRDVLGESLAEPTTRVQMKTLSTN